MIHALRPPLVLALALWLAAAVTAAPAAPAAPQKPDAADRCTVPAALREGLPPEAGLPVEVEIEFVVVDVTDVNDGAQTFRADFVVGLYWRDPRLAASARGRSLAGCALELTSIWHPDVRPLNLRTRFGELSGQLRVGDDGSVSYQTRVAAEFSARLHLRDFPFDRQALRIRVASFSHGPEAIRFVPRNVARLEGHDFSLAGWSVLGEAPDTGVEPLRLGTERFARIDHVIHVAREPGYFLWNFVLPLSLIVLMAWTVFWLDPDSSAPQIGIATASAFTLVAFLIALRSRLPPVPYLTRLDELILYSTLLVFAALAQVIATSRLAQIGRLDLARRLDSYGRWLYIGVFAAVIYLTLMR